VARGVADKRSAILRAAVRLFGSGHYHSTTIPSLAREAGVAEGSIYNYFRSKEEVAFVALAETAAAIERDLVAAVPRQAAPLEQLSYAAATLLQLAEEDLEAARYVLVSDHETFLGARAADAHSLARVICRLVVAAADRGETREAPAELLAAIWLAVVRAAIAARAAGALTSSLVEVEDAIAGAAVDAIRRVES
jgi:AcrR family transcriptional regulator